MAITLQLEMSGKEKTFVAPAPKARMIRNAIEITEHLDEKKLTTADLDGMADFVVEVFGKKFTVDDLYDGIEADKFASTLLNVINGLMGGMSSPNAQAAK